MNTPKTEHALLCAGERMPDGTWPPLPLVWHSAQYLKSTMRAVDCVAAHVHGNMWRVIYRDGGPLGLVIERDVHSELVRL